MIIRKLKKNKGFVLLFAVTLAAIFLSIALGMADIALKEVNFSTSAQSTNDAFFAADTGSEQVLYLDKNPATYPPPSLLTLNATIPYGPYTYTGLGGEGLSCAMVSITKTTKTTNSQNPNDQTSYYTAISVVSKGYNNQTSAGNCTPTSNTVERELDVNY